MICSKCKEKEVQFTSPAKLCEGCWVDWWVDGLGPKNDKQRAEWKEETLRDVVKSLR